MNGKRFILDLKPKILHIETGGKFVILNELDAKEIGILPTERVEIFNPICEKRETAIVEITDKLPKGTIGILGEVSKSIDCVNNELVKVAAAPKPSSLKLIKKKVNGENLTASEIQKVVDDIKRSLLSEIEMSAFMTSVYIHGYNFEETVAMTKGIANSGRKINLNKSPILDKHCIGGINGRATMLVVPIVAAEGFFIPKTSSRSITSACGTADAMEVLANVSLEFEEIVNITEKTGAVICWGGAVDLAPVDDAIIKIEHPLSLDPPGQVVASVMAKKASVGAEFVVIDLPVGPDVKIKNMKDAKKLANKFINVGKELGIKVEAILTDGTEPSGNAFGPALEAKLVLEILEGKVYDNLAQKACELSGALFELVGRTKKGEGTKLAMKILKSGRAKKKMLEIIEGQGKKVDSSEEIVLSDLKHLENATQTGQISRINVKELARIARLAGAPSHIKAGVRLNVEEGAKIKKGKLLFEIFAENQRKLEVAIEHAKKYPPIEFEKIILQKLS